MIDNNYLEFNRPGSIFDYSIMQLKKATIHLSIMKQGDMSHIEEKFFQLFPGQEIIGGRSKESAQLIIDDRSISRLHFKILLNKNCILR